MFGSGAGQRLRGDERGATAVIFGLAFIPIAGLMAGAIDFSRATEHKGEMQQAADAAALGAAQYMRDNAPKEESERPAVEAKAKAYGASIFSANYTPDTTAPAIEPVFTFQGNRVLVTASTGLPTTFLNIVGIETLDLAALSEAEMPGLRDVEVAMVLDYSNSMKDNNKYVRMADAAKEFIAKVKETNSGGAKIGLVPFSTLVAGELTGEHLRGVIPSHYNTLLKVCLANRDYSFSTSDETPVKTLEGSRWPAFNLPQSVVSASLKDLIPDLGAAGGGAKESCTKSIANGVVVHDLTDDFDGLITAVGAMQPVHYTNIALGAEIGWHMLSPNAPYEEGVVYSDKEVKKVLILLTDGEQTVSASGPNGASPDEADRVTAEVCDNMATAEIEVYTIAYDLKDESTRNLLRNCASQDENFFTPSVSSNMSEVFDQIFESMMKTVRLTQ